VTSVRFARRRTPTRAHYPLRAKWQPAPAESLQRALSLSIAVVGIVAAAPVMAAIALLIKLTSPGPVLYVQTRVGIDRRAQGAPAGNNRRSTDCGGKPFTIYKFRTMAANGDGPGGEVWARPDDPRVTRLGRILRLYRLDELPQLLNVLRGDMNVVGPRPEQPAIFARLRQQIDRYQERQRVRPGITGWAQVNLSYDSSVDDVRNKLAYDLEYVHRQSALTDLKIILRTFPVVLFKLGAW
jgi:lipopolysaccharide/colanic/teichoic acid biosynthesis glycosyltransferase